MSEIAEVAVQTPARLARGARYYEIKREVEEFLFDEANLLDERRFKEWVDTLAEDLEYFMPMTFNVKFGEHVARENTTREKHMSWFNEGKWTLTKRAEQILTGVHWAEEPLSRVCRLVTNVQLTGIATNEAGEEEVSVSSRFLIYQNRCEHEQYFFVGDRRDVIRRTASGWQLAKREIQIHQNVLLAKNLTVFF
ncbi:3-phenylpropionate dioxygenase [Variovorax sp. WS11]|uniref:3-phenylpropionate/cinnamic acid dioxygenase subunit beta n=1 Tax=Variovorax sp. WS11 TaxID=1105204 RepID=UPI000D0DCB33|nr:3-phenylpropionate/cinnamic acid dioxygenase subunit beta [Variovorax sp. WS11]NDZ11898.1 3-phenylpropionate/cinnamic acid dioxygenase subunit beta [Variovorax sp. WS11]PSL80693.1 3-phenylpropionate dioxygenase [Variovorax sp. WS11]